MRPAFDAAIVDLVQPFLPGVGYWYIFSITIGDVFHFFFHLGGADDEKVRKGDLDSLVCRFAI